MDDQTVEKNSLGRFRLMRLLSRAEWGLTYQAVDTQTDIAVRLHLIRPSLAQQTYLQESFHSVVEQVSRLAHPGLVPIYQTGETDGRFFIATAYVPGLNIGHHIPQWIARQQPIQLDEALLLTAELAETLGYLHLHDVHHLALTPDRLLITRKPTGTGLPLQAAILDTGIGHLLDNLVSATATEFVDRIPYRAPELLFGQVANGRSDLFSLGVILHQLVTALPPAVNDEKPVPLPKSVRNIIHQAMAANPADRFTSGATMAAALRHTADQLSTHHPQQHPANAISLTQFLPEPVVNRLIIFGQREETARIVPLNKQQLILGRSRTSDICLPAHDVSRHHLRLEQTTNGWQIVDLRSKNGTFIDEKRLLPEHRTLWSPHEPLHIGPYTLRLS